MHFLKDRNSKFLKVYEFYIQTGLLNRASETYFLRDPMPFMN